MLRKNGILSTKDYTLPLNWHQTLRKIQYTYQVIALWIRVTFNKYTYKLNASNITVI